MRNCQRNLTGFLTLSLKMYSSYDISDRKAWIWIEASIDYELWKMIADMIACACNLLQIPCFSENGRENVAYLQSFAADMQHIRLVI